MLSKITLERLDTILSFYDRDINKRGLDADGEHNARTEEINCLRDIIQNEIEVRGESKNKENFASHADYMSGANQLVKLLEESINCLIAGEVEKYVPDIGYMGDKENIIRMAKNHVNDIGALNLPINTYSLDIISALLLLVDNPSENID